MDCKMSGVLEKCVFQGTYPTPLCCFWRFWVLGIWINWQQGVLRNMTKARWGRIRCVVLLRAIKRDEGSSWKESYFLGPGYPLDGLAGTCIPTHPPVQTLKESLYLESDSRVSHGIAGLADTGVPCSTFYDGQIFAVHNSCKVLCNGLLNMEFNEYKM